MFLKQHGVAEKSRLGKIETMAKLCGLHDTEDAEEVQAGWRNSGFDGRKATSTLTLSRPQVNPCDLRV